jgi:hypothetical protein
MMKQTGGEWSAPLDDVFIHLDYAVAIAKGHPLEWVPGNGVSSGNTSLLYPFVLAVGVLFGAKGGALLHFAAVVAATSIFATCLALRRVAESHGVPVLSYLVPPALLFVGALNWTLWSGMEVAFFLAAWSVALVAYDGFVRERVSVFWLALGNVWLVSIRPEAATTALMFACAAALRRRGTLSDRARVAFVSGAPAACFLVLQSVLNRALTGEWSPAGALVKLSWHNPYFTPQARWDEWKFLMEYVAARVIEYHFTDEPRWGWALVALSLLGLAHERTRALTALLWAQAVGWVAFVAMNGQVRWQNERYVMPAVAWVLVSAALGLYSAFLRSEAPVRTRRRWMAVVGALVGMGVGASLRAHGEVVHWTGRLAAGLVIGAAMGAALTARRVAAPVALALATVAYVHQAPRMREQRWFFGRASRNIRDQHVTAGRFLRELAPERILLGDAGALVYASERPAIDLIGLGGFRSLPFARAGVQGLAASLELIERLPKSDWPDVMALYPSWWGVLPLWFASRPIATFPVEGNVICGGYEKVIYPSRLDSLGRGEQPFGVTAGTVRDTIDMADLVSEAAHRYAPPTPVRGFTSMKILDGPGPNDRDVFDGGRRTPPGQRETFRFSGLEAGHPARIRFRTASEGTVRVRVTVSSATACVVEHPLELEWTSVWVEPEVELPESCVGETADVRIDVDGPTDFVSYHGWILQ